MTQRTPQRRPVGEDQQVKILRKENETLLEELEYWRTKFSDQEQNELKQMQHLMRENEILRTKFIQMDLKSKALLGSDHIINDLRVSCDELEQENRALSNEVQVCLDRIKEYEVLIAKIRQNEDEIRMFHLNLKEENSQLKKALQQQMAETALQNQAKDNFSRTRIGQIESQLSGQIQQLSFDLKVSRDAVEKLTKMNEAMKQETLVLQTNLAQEYDMRRKNEITIEMLQKKTSALEEQRSTDYNMLIAQRDQQIQSFGSAAIQEKDQLLKQISILESKFQESQSLMQQLYMQNQALQQQLVLTKDQSAAQAKHIGDLTSQLNIVALSSQQEIVKRDVIRSTQMQEIRQSHIAQADSMSMYQEQLKNELVQKMAELDINQKTIEKLSLYINKFELNINQLIDELDQWKQKFIQLDQQRVQELRMKDDYYLQIIDHFRKTLYEQMGTSESKLQNLKILLDKKSFECHLLKDQKEELSHRFSQYSQQVQQFQFGQQRLMTEIEATQLQLIESRQNSPSDSRYRNPIEPSPHATANFGN